VSWVKVVPAARLATTSQVLAVQNQPGAVLDDGAGQLDAPFRARLGGGAIQVEISGVTGRGKPPVIQDTFRYSRNGCK